MPADDARTPAQEFWVILRGAYLALFLLVGDWLTAPTGLAWRSDGDPGMWRALSVPPLAYRLLVASLIVLLPCLALWRLRRSGHAAPLPH